MRRVVVYGEPAGVPASQKLKHKLSLTPGLHLLSSNFIGLGCFLGPLGDPQDERVLHKTSWATRNFVATSAALETLTKRELWATMRNPCPTLETGRTVFDARAEAENQCDGGGLRRGYKDRKGELHRRINSGARLGKCPGDGEEVPLPEVASMLSSCSTQGVEESDMGKSVFASPSKLTSSPSLSGKDLRHGSDIWAPRGPDEQKSTGDLSCYSTCAKEYLVEGVFGHRKTQDAEISESGGAVPHELSSSQFKDSVSAVGKVRGERPHPETKALAVAFGEADVILSRSSSHIEGKLQRVTTGVDILGPDITTNDEPYLRKDGVCLSIFTDDGVSPERVKCKQSAAREIQRYCRGWLQRMYFREVKWTVVILQSLVRRNQELKQYRTLLWAAAVLQKNWRMVQSLRFANHLKLEQPVLEQHIMDGAAVLLQKHWRAPQSMRVVKYLKMEQAVREQQRMIDAAILLQKHWRAVQSRHFVNSLEMQKIAHAAIMLQRNWRVFESRYLVEHLKMQQVIGEQQRTDAAITLQWHWRALSCRCLVEHLRMKHGMKNQQRIDNAVILQKHWPGFQSRSLVKLLKFEQIESAKQSFNNAAMMLQRPWRAAQSRRVLKHSEKGEGVNKQQKIDDAAITLQKHWRGLQFRLMLKNINAGRELAAVCIQAHMRVIAPRVKLRTQEAAALVIQRAWRRYWSSQRTLSPVSIQQACCPYSNQNREIQVALVLNDSTPLSHGITGALDGVPAGNQEMGCLSELDLGILDASGYLSNSCSGNPLVQHDMYVHCVDQLHNSLDSLGRPDLGPICSIQDIEAHFSQCLKVSFPSTSGESQLQSNVKEEDWNYVPIDHLDECLDTCLAVLRPLPSVLPASVVVQQCLLRLDILEAAVEHTNQDVHLYPEESTKHVDRITGSSGMPTNPFLTGQQVPRFYIDEYKTECKVLGQDTCGVQLDRASLLAYDSSHPAQTLLSVNLDGSSDLQQEASSHQVVPKNSRVFGETHRSKTIEQNEKQLQQFAQVFLLQRHITLQQQRAQAAPPFPPIAPSGSGFPSSLATQSLEIESSNLSFTDARTAVPVQIKPVDTSSRWVVGDQKLVHETMNSGDQPTLKEKPLCKQNGGVSTKQVIERPERDVILDMVLLLTQIEEEYGTARTAFEGESSTCFAPSYSDIEEGSPLLGYNMGSIQNQSSVSCVANSISIKRIGIPDVNAMLLVLIAMVVYTRTICRGVFYRSRQTDRKV